MNYRDDDWTEADEAYENGAAFEPRPAEPPHDCAEKGCGPWCTAGQW